MSDTGTTPADEASIGNMVEEKIAVLRNEVNQRIDQFQARLEEISALVVKSQKPTTKEKK